MPALEKVCVAFAKVAVVMLTQGVPSPKLQFHVVGVFVEVSLNRTVSGAVPEVLLAVKLATGTEDDPVTVIYPAVRVLLYPPLLNACNAT